MTDNAELTRDQRDDPVFNASSKGWSANMKKD